MPIPTTYDATNQATSYFVFTGYTVGNVITPPAPGSFPSGTSYTDVTLDGSGQIVVNLLLSQLKGAFFIEDVGAQSGLYVVSAGVGSFVLGADAGPAASGKDVRVVYSS